MNILKLLEKSFKSGKEVIGFVANDDLSDDDPKRFFCIRVGEGEECTLTPKEFMKNLEGMDYIEKLTGPISDMTGGPYWKLVVKDTSNIIVHTFLDVFTRIHFSILDPSNIIPEDDITVD